MKSVFTEYPWDYIFVILTDVRIREDLILDASNMILKMKFGFNRFLIYSGFGLDRFHSISKNKIFLDYPLTFQESQGYCDRAPCICPAHFSCIFNSSLSFISGILFLYGIVAQYMYMLMHDKVLEF